MVEGEGRNPERCGPVLKDFLRDRRLSRSDPEFGGSARSRDTDC
jgi:hypothetical protein